MLGQASRPCWGHGRGQGVAIQAREAEGRASLVRNVSTTLEGHLAPGTHHLTRLARRCCGQLAALPSELSAAFRGDGPAFARLVDSLVWSRTPLSRQNVPEHLSAPARRLARRPPLCYDGWREHLPASAEQRDIPLR